MTQAEQMRLCAIFTAECHVTLAHAAMKATHDPCIVRKTLNQQNWVRCKEALLRGSRLTSQANALCSSFAIGILIGHPPRGDRFKPEQQ